MNPNNEKNGEYTKEVVSFLIAGYNSARGELVERIKSRDNAVRLYITSVSVVFGAFTFFGNQIAGTNGLVPAGLVAHVLFSALAVFGLAMSQSVANNQIKIATIGYFIDKELVVSLRKLTNSNDILDWESSETNKKSSRLPRKLHYIYYYMIFLLPQAAGIFLAIWLATYGAPSAVVTSLNYHVLFLVFEMLCLFGTFYVLNLSNRTRSSYNLERKHR